MSNELSLDIRYWTTGVKQALSEYHPVVYELLNDAGVDDDVPFVVVEYQYGQLIENRGEFYLPTVGGDVVKYSSLSDDNELKQILGDNIIICPFGFVVDGHIDAFWEMANSSVKIRGHNKTGDLFGLRTLIDEPNIYDFRGHWNYASGSRGIFFLPSLKDAGKFKKLQKKYDIQCFIPESFHDQWSFLVELYKKLGVSTWKTQLILCSESFVNRLKQESRYSAFREYVFNIVWMGTYFGRNRGAFDFLWECFIRYIEEHKYKYQPHIYNLAKHIVLVALGEEYAFAPVIETDNTMAPIEDLSKALMEVYKMSYAPSFMKACKFNWHVDQPVYYSLQHIAHLDPFPMKKTMRSDLDDLKDVRTLIERFLNYVITTPDTKLENSKLVELLEVVEFDYFHVVPDQFNKITSSQEIADQDARFLAYNKVKSSAADKFCHASPFFKGCIRVGRKKA